MDDIFLKLLNMSINAGWLILAVIVLRLLLRKAPAWISCLLWALVAVRLVCPFSLESIFSLIPSGETIPRETVFSPAPAVDSGVKMVDTVVNPIMRESFAPVPGDSVNPLQAWLFIAGLAWAAVACALLFYAAVSSLRLYLKIRTAVRLKGRIYLSEFIDTPFIFGIIRPRIYLPSDMPEELRLPVIAHEQAHLERLDFFWKIFGYILLSVYWFHPLCWAAYILFCRDLELACDEKVIQNYDTNQKKLYSEALLACSLRQRRMAVRPLAFGEVGVKRRIQSVINYKKPAFWAVTAAVVVCIAAAVCFLTDPVEETSGSAENAAADSENSTTRSENRTTRSENSTIRSEAPEDASGPASPEQLVSQWCNAFVNRDGNGIASMASETVIAGLRERELLSGPEGQRSFGESSPWPLDEETDVFICSMDSGHAEINYYAWTSEPHVTVWRETIRYELRGGVYAVTEESLLWLDEISDYEAFAAAYGEPFSLDGSRADYLNNGALDSLSRNAMLSSSMLYRGLFQPESAAVELLNLSDDPAKVKVERILAEEQDTVGLEITFLQDDISVQISMSRPGGEEGIWIPMDYRISPLYRLSRLDWEEVRRRQIPVKADGDWWNTEDIICLGRIPEQDIAIYGYNDEDCFGQGVAVDMGGNVSYFDWTYTSPQTIAPEFYWNADGRQLQASLHIYTGTGVSADELHILCQDDTGTWKDNAFGIDDYSSLLSGRIGFGYEDGTGMLTLVDLVSQNELWAAKTEDVKATGLELGCISDFVLGRQMSLRVEPGYFTGDGAIAEYEGMPTLDIGLLLQEGDGGLSLELGDIIVLDP